MSVPMIPAARPILAYRRSDGAAIALVPSCSKPGAYHVVTASGSCDCRSFHFRGSCSHQITAEAIRFPVASSPAPLPCTCGNYHLTPADRIKAHPEANDLRDGGAAHLAVKRALGDWPAKPSPRDGGAS